MELGELIDKLEQRDPNKEVKNGFGFGMSYRGDYAQAAFEPVSETTFGEMLRHAKDLIGTVQDGYKGGEYRMYPYVDVYIAAYGCGGREITDADFLHWDGESND